MQKQKYRKILNQIGAAPVLELLLVIVVVGILGFLGYRYYQSTQVKTDQTTTQPAAPAKTIFKVKELGFEFELPDSLKGLEYTIGASESPHVAYFDIKDFDPGCEDKSDGSIGVAEITDPETTPTAKLMKKFSDDKALYYGAPQNVCSDDKAVNAKTEEYVSALEAALKSAELSK